MISIPSFIQQTGHLDQIACLFSFSLALVCRLWVDENFLRKAWNHPAWSGDILNHEAFVCSVERQGDEESIQMLVFKA